MAMTKTEIMEWLNALADDAVVAIDEGGLALVEVVGDGAISAAYIEVGGAPEEGEETR